MPIVLLSKLLRNPLPARVTGADMVPAICRRCAEEGLSVYVLGGDKEVVEEAFAKMDSVEGHVIPNAPGGGLGTSRPAILAGHDDSFIKLDQDQPEIIERINAAKPDVLFVALGNPKQELWMGRNRAKLDVGVMIGVGGTFNFIAGRVKRAPKWMQRCGLEWIYRIIQEPGRLWKRYFIGLIKFNIMVLGALLNRPRKGGAELVRDEGSGIWRTTSRGRFSPRALAEMLVAADAGTVRIENLSRRQKRQLRAFRMAHLVEG